MARKLKIMENEKHTLEDWKLTKSLKNVKNEKEHLRTWNMARKLNIRENEYNTIYVVKYDEKF